LPEIIVQNVGFEQSIRDKLNGLSGLASDEICITRKVALGLTCDPKQLAERIVQVDSNTSVIAGARFKSLNANFPFIEVQKNCPLFEIDLEKLTGALKREFAEIKPLGFLILDKPNLTDRAGRWGHTVFGPISENETAGFIDGLTPDWIKEIDFFEEYQKAYIDRLTDKSELMGFVRVADLQELQESVAKGLLLKVLDRGALAGVFAGLPEPIYGLNAIYMIESFLLNSYVGKGFALPIHQYYLSHLAGRFGYVWGTIYNKNTTSMKTALRLGRKVIESEYFFELK
jgi:hypothetical protein